MQRLNHGKTEQGGQYLDFARFIPLAYRRGDAWSISAHQKPPPQEENFLPETPIRNRYSAKLTDVLNWQRPLGDPICKATKKAVYIRLAFRESHIENDGSCKCFPIINCKFLSEEFRTPTTTPRTTLNQCESVQISYSASHLVYQFACSCGRTNPRLSEWMLVPSPWSDRWQETLWTVILIVIRGQQSRNIW